VLSEEERRRLNEIEAGLTADYPALARRLERRASWHRGRLPHAIVALLIAVTLIGWFMGSVWPGILFGLLVGAAAFGYAVAMAQRAGARR
jgi:Protein of unknown function (DUF3040)